MNLSDKIAVVTGGGRGIGLAISGRLARAGARVVVLDRDPATAEQAAQQIGGHHFAVDVARSDEVERVCAEIERSVGPVDILVNNAGIVHEDSSADITDDTWQRVIDVNLNGTFFPTRAFGRHMLARRSGSIVNISSISAIIGTGPESNVAYGAAKAAVAQLARSLAVEWGPSGVRINAVAPGRTRTPMLEVVTSSEPERLALWLQHVPQGRILEPDEIANAVAFLASDDASAITGHTLVVDGGHTIA